ncbi:protein phosphatase 2C domain-containing protein [Pyxidicoccus parkwayensis]|uniref:Protein phosphatase 2C domain-containing protein n=1 Tax=Pyxidicoccus parkwayensis TaxID=2813578 RepID=A0ABX7NME5_9BACT|nr:protein phosphatase 2C domain-containing protein [Pyxidicoccus parkwaysis]QSQ19524.1 protein phosphatase 2C domain-containing protein [Pyxidicoccus parkwaysis]
MRIHLEAASLQKAGNAPSENEDAYAPESRSMLEGMTLHAAVADGATESLFSGLWARLLAGAFARGEVADASGLLSVLPALQRQWHEHVGAKQLPWYAEEKLREGAFATLLGVTLREQEGRRTWEALAIGDSCLFQLRGGVLLRAFPLEQSAAFGSTPFLLSTHAHQNGRVGAQVRSASGDLRDGDTLYLMTDALACWFLAEHERGHAPWTLLPGTFSGEGRAAFEALIGRLRAEKAMRNDDVTLLQLTVEQ